jgi:deoxyribonuclease IV
MLIGAHESIAGRVSQAWHGARAWSPQHPARAPGEILEHVRRPDRLGVCLDTCHLHAAGYDMTTATGYESVLAQFDRTIGLGRVKCFHLNDCQKPLGSRVDRHEEIGRGALGISVFRRLVNDPRFAQTVGVLETPAPERFGEALRLLHSLVQG